MRETEIAAAVVEFLRAEGWAVHCEVEVLGLGHRRADIVATKTTEDGPTLWLVEAKARLGWDVIWQAYDWAGWAHHRSVATATGPHGHEGFVACRALQALGLGWLRVVDGEVFEECPAPWAKAPRKGLVTDALRPEHATATPGTAGGSRPWTESDEAMRLLAALVAREPGVDMLHAIRRLGWDKRAAARAALVRTLRSGCVEGVTITRDGERWVLTPSAERSVF